MRCSRRLAAAMAAGPTGRTARRTSVRASPHDTRCGSPRSTLGGRVTRVRGRPASPAPTSRDRPWGGSALVGTEASEPARGALGAGRRTNRWGQIEEIALATRHPARGFERIDDVLVDGGGQHGDGATPIRDLEALAAADSTQGCACVLLQLSHADLLHVRQCITTEPLGTKTELHRVGMIRTDKEDLQIALRESCPGNHRCARAASAVGAVAQRNVLGFGSEFMT